MNSQDRGLQAVTRVRGVREQDSKLGLQQATKTVRERVCDQQQREDALAAAPPFSAGSGGDFLVARHALATMASEVSAAADRVAAGQTVAAEALGRWQNDKTRLRAVELLGDRRAARRRAELQRAEDRESDDVAGRRWLRGRSERRSS